MKPRKNLPKMSEATRLFNAELDAMRPLVLARSHGFCECARDCSRNAHQIHHVTRRSQGGTNELGNLLHLSHDCHAWVHAHPREARALGLLGSGHTTIRPALVNGSPNAVGQSPQSQCHPTVAGAGEFPSVVELYAELFAPVEK